MAALVFVYGSLKRGLLHHDKLRGAQFVDIAEVGGYALVLYEDAYPALYEEPSAERPVLGEIFSVSPETLAELDLFEDVPQLYQRVLLTLTDGTRAWAYVISPDVARGYPTLEGPWQGRSAHGTARSS